MSNLNYDTISYLVYGFGGVITEFNTLNEAKKYAKTCSFEIKKVAILDICCDTPNIKKAKQLLEEQRDILAAIKTTEGWFNLDRSNKDFIYHDKLKNFLFDTAFNKMPVNYKKHLLSKFNHKTHFLEGVSRAEALEYYYLSPDFTWDDENTIKNHSREIGSQNITPTIAMKAYWHAIDETIVAIFDGKIDIKSFV